MFDGKDVLTLDGDHLDITFRAEEAWPSMTPAGSIKYHAFGIGDPQSGPVVQLGCPPPQSIPRAHGRPSRWC